MIKVNLFDKFRKKSIEIVCPACGASQSEPVLAYSTYCRSCNEHLKIAKGVAQLHEGPRLSGLAAVRVLSEAPAAVPDSPEPQPANKGKRNASRKRADGSSPQVRKKRTKAPGKTKASAGSESEKAPEAEDPAEEPMNPFRARPPISVAEVFGLAPSAEAAEPSGGEDVSPASAAALPFLNPSAAEAGAGLERNIELTEGSMGALIGDLVDLEQKRMLANQSAAAGPIAPSPAPAPRTKVKVRCFRCHHRQWVSKFAESTQCGRCNTYISLLDFEIRQSTDRIIRTRGNITVYRKGSLIGPETACRDLIAMGPVTTRLDCSGEARFKFASSISGPVFCEQLVIEKGIIVEFSDGVRAESVSIQGTLLGNVFCGGQVSIGRTGILDGDVTARQVDFPDGGTLTGKLTIDENYKIELPVVKGYDPSIIE